MHTWELAILPLHGIELTQELPPGCGRQAADGVLVHHDVPHLQRWQVLEGGSPWRLPVGLFHGG